MYPARSWPPRLVTRVALGWPPEGGGVAGRTRSSGRSTTRTARRRERNPESSGDARGRTVLALSSYERRLASLPRDVVLAAREAEREVAAGREASYAPKMLRGYLRERYRPEAYPVQLRLRRQYRLIALVSGSVWRFAWVGSHEEANRVTGTGWSG